MRTNSLKAGLSLVSSIAFTNGTPQEIGLPAKPGDQLFRWNPITQRFSTYTFDSFTSNWLPEAPILQTGEAVFLDKVASANWTEFFLAR